MRKFKKKKIKVCIFSLTYNRPEYIERSFDSLYKRAGIEFTHLVFDDGSDKETLEKLKELRKKYKFKLFIDKKKIQVGVYRRFQYSLLKIPANYDYYIKFDSDVELLSDEIFREMLEVFSFPGNTTSCLSPRVEGIMGFDRNQAILDFYRGHAVRFDSQIISGCCLIFPQHVFVSFPKLQESTIMQVTERWGADLVLYEHAKKLGKCAVIENVSVYHIDNAYGQRKKYSEYFIERKRWDNLDVFQVQCVLMSKRIYPGFIKRSLYEIIKRESTSYKMFISLCDIAVKDPKRFEEKVDGIEKQKQQFLIDKKSNIIKQEHMQKEMYKITSPPNFKPTEYIPHGEYRYFSEIPAWAKNNPCVVIEKEMVFVANTSKKEVAKLEEKAKETGKAIKTCKECGYKTTSTRRMKTHTEKKHGKITEKKKK